MTIKSYLTYILATLYLGHNVTADMADDADIRRNMRLDAHAQGNMIIRKFHMCTPGVKWKVIETH